MVIVWGLLLLAIVIFVNFLIYRIDRDGEWHPVNRPFKAPAMRRYLNRKWEYRAITPDESYELGSSEIW